MKNFFWQHKGWLWPLLFTILITPFTPQIDLAIEQFFYEGNGQFSSNPWFSFIFQYGVWPAFFVSGLALLVLICSYFFEKIKHWRKVSFILVFTLVIGSGLITHLLLKEHYGRPRPKQIVEFGGVQQFRPYYSPEINAIKEPSKSFSCGHCTMGFYFFSFVMLGSALKNRRLFWIGLILSTGLGSLLSLTRMAQGGHFFSDTLFSALIMWLTAYFLTNLTFKSFSKDSLI